MGRCNGLIQKAEERQEKVPFTDPTGSVIPDLNNYNHTLFMLLVIIRGASDGELTSTLQVRRGAGEVS